MKLLPDLDGFLGRVSAVYHEPGTVPDPHTLESWRDLAMSALCAYRDLQRENERLVREQYRKHELAERRASAQEEFTVLRASGVKRKHAVSLIAQRFDVPKNTARDWMTGLP